MRKTLIPVTVSVMSILICLSCLTSGLTEQSKTSMQTAIFQTIEANLTATTSSQQPTNPPLQEATTTIPTLTPAPTSSPLPGQTVVQIPCNMATFVADVTIPDGMQMAANNTFIKTWRFTNSGTCTWNTSYQLIFTGGEQMGAPAAINLPNQVYPGATIDVSVQLTSPTNSGSFTGYFKLKSDTGTIFGMGPGNSALSVIITTSGQPSVVGDPDLIVSSLSINNGNPVQDKVNTSVSVVIYNAGQTAAKDFDVEFWGAETFALRDCAWDVNLLAPQTSMTLNCNMTYNSWYASGKMKAKVVVDPVNAVQEANETNNIYLQTLYFQGH